MAIVWRYSGHPNAFSKTRRGRRLARYRPAFGSVVCCSGDFAPDWPGALSSSKGLPVRRSARCRMAESLAVVRIS